MDRTETLIYVIEDKLGAQKYCINTIQKVLRNLKHYNTNTLDITGLDKTELDKKLKKLTIATNVLKDFANLTELNIQELIQIIYTQLEPTK